MPETVLHPIIYFSTFMMKYVIPYDTRLATLRKKRDFQKKKDFFNLFIDFLTTYKSFTEDNLPAIEVPFLKLTIPIYDAYYVEIKKAFESQLNVKCDLNDLNKQIEDVLLKNLEDPKELKEAADIYIEVLSKMDNALEITMPTDTLSPTDSFISSDIFSVETEILTKILFLAIEDHNIFQDEIEKFRKALLVNNLPQEEMKSKEATIHYLTIVVYNELWNFLTHVSHAATFGFLAPRYFISDIEKASSHFRRASLDIYEGIIVEMYHHKITPEYLNLRNQKLASLGDSTKIQSLRENIKKFYEDVIKTI